MHKDLKHLLVSGGHVVLTGEMEISSRMDVLEIFTAMGLLTSASVSSKTTFLIAGRGAKQAKIDRAKSLGIPIVSEADFWTAVDEMFPPEA